MTELKNDLLDNGFNQILTLPEPIFTALERATDKTYRALRLDEIIREKDPQSLVSKRQLAFMMVTCAEKTSTHLQVNQPDFSLLEILPENMGTNLQLHHFDDGTIPLIEVNHIFITKIGRLMRSSKKLDRIYAGIIINHKISHEVRHEFQFVYQSELVRQADILQAQVLREKRKWTESDEYFCNGMELDAEKWAIQYLESKYPDNSRDLIVRQVWNDYLSNVWKNYHRDRALGIKMGFLKPVREKKLVA